MIWDNEVKARYARINVSQATLSPACARRFDESNPVSKIARETGIKTTYCFGTSRRWSTPFSNVSGISSNVAVRKIPKNHVLFAKKYCSMSRPATKSHGKSSDASMKTTMQYAMIKRNSSMGQTCNLFHQNIPHQSAKT